MNPNDEEDLFVPSSYYIGVLYTNVIKVDNKIEKIENNVI